MDELAQRRRGPRTKALLGLLFVLAVLAVGRFVSSPRPGTLTVDERDYLRAAVHLARDGVISHAPVGIREPAADAYREPAYSALLALTWSLGRVDLGFAEDDFPASPEAASARRAARGLHLVLLLVAAAAAALAVYDLGSGRVAAAVAGLAVLVSPALGASGRLLAGENLAAPLVALTGAALLASRVRPGRGWTLAAGAASGLLVLVRAAGAVFVPVGFLLLALLPSGSAGSRARGRGALLFLAAALLAPGFWMARNGVRVGHFVVSDRGGQVLWTRAELDRQIGREGVLPALLEWTPAEWVRETGRRLWPEATFARYGWTGEGNFFTRSLRRWQSERERADDGIAADRRLEGVALREFLRRPGDHLLASFAVSWRGLFAERTPASWSPIDGRLPIGLGLLAANLLLLARALRRRDPRPILLLALPLTLFIFHAAATEFLPRFAVPALPLVWAGAVAGLARGPREASHPGA